MSLIFLAIFIGESLFGMKFTLATIDDWKDSTPWTVEEMTELVEKWNKCFKN